MSELPSDVLEALELLNRFIVAEVRGPHAAGFSIAIDIADGSGVCVTEAPASYIVSSDEVDGAALWIDQTSADADRNYVAALTADPPPAPRTLEGVLMRASRASDFGFPRMNAITIDTLSQAAINADAVAASDPWIVLVGSTAANAKELGGLRRLPSERARIEAAHVEMQKPQARQTESLASFRVERGVDEAYRVMREPTSHGGPIGWQVTLWRARAQWKCDVVALDFFAPHAVIRTGPGEPMKQPAIDRVLAAIEAEAFWDDKPRPERMGLDGYRVFFEGIRAGRTREYSAWCPTGDAMFLAFAAIAQPPERRSWLGCTLVLALLAAAIGYGIYALSS